METIKMKTINPLQKRRSRIFSAEARVAYICLIPAFLGLIFLTYLPLVGVLGISLTNWTGLKSPVFIGLDNYIKIFTTDPYIKDSIISTIYFAALSVTGSMIYSLFIALLLNRKIPARGFFRAVFYVPYVLPAAAIYVGWSWLYEGNFGFFNYVLSELGLNKILFIADSSFVVPSLPDLSLAGGEPDCYLSGGAAERSGGLP